MGLAPLLVALLLAAPAPEERAQEPSARQDRRLVPEQRAAEPPVDTADMLSWRPVAAHLDRENLDEAVVLLAERVRERERVGLTTAPFFAAELMRRARGAAPALSARLYNMARAVAPGSAEVELDALADAVHERGLVAEVVSGMPAWRAALKSPAHRAALESLLASGVLWGAVVALVVLAVGLVLRHGLALVHDVGTTLPSWLRSGGFPLALTAGALLVAVAWAGPVPAALVALLLLAAHLEWGERIAAAVALLAVGGLLLAQAPTPRPVQAPIPGDLEACKQGACDPATTRRIEADSTGASPEPARALLALTALREEDPDRAARWVGERPPLTADLTVIQSFLALERARAGCGGRDAATAAQRDTLVQQLGPLARFRDDLPAAYDRSVLAFLVGRTADAVEARADARALDDAAVDAAIRQGRLQRRAPEDADDVARELCAPHLSALGQLMPPALHPAPERRVVPPPGLGPVAPGVLGPAALAVAGLVLVIGALSRRWRLAARCLACGRLFSARRHLEVAGLSECERCLHQRVVGVLNGPGDRWRLARDYVERAKRGVRQRHLWSLLLPGAGASAAGRPLAGWSAAALLATGVAVSLLAHTALPEAPYGASLHLLLDPVAVALALVGLLVLLASLFLPPVADPAPRAFHAAVEEGGE